MRDHPRGLAFPFRVDPERGGIARTGGPEKLRDNVVHILLTGLGERTMLREYGTSLRQILHDPVNHAFLSVVQHQIAKAITTWEPRVEVASVEVRGYRVGSGTDGGEGPGTLGAEPPGDAVIAEVEFIIRATRQPVNLSIPVALGGA